MTALIRARKDMSDHDVRYEVDEGVSTIIIDRPTVHNAFRNETILELNSAIEKARFDDEVDNIVLTGAGDSFCAGADTADLTDWRNESKTAYAGYLWSVQNVIRQLRDTDKASIAAVSGAAIGAGCDFALGCDLRVVGTDAFFKASFVDVGLVPGDGGAWLLPRLIGESAAKKHLLTGESISAKTALDLGLAYEVSDDPLDAAYTLADELLSKPTKAIRYTKQLMNPRWGFEKHCERAIEFQWECMNDPEHHESI